MSFIDNEYDRILQLAQQGNEFASSGQWANALQVYQEADQLQPDNVVIKKCLALMLLMLRSYESAAALYAEIITLDPSDADGHHGYGSALAWQVVNMPEKDPGVMASAKSSLERAARMLPNDAVKWSDLAWVCSQTGDMDQSFNYYLRSLQISPYDENTIYYFLEMLRANNRFTEAINTLNDVDSQLKKHPGVWYILGRIYESCGNLGQAIRHLQEAALRNPTSKHIKTYLSKLSEKVK